MFRLFFAAVFVVSLALVPAGVVGQETNATSSPAPATPADEIAVEIDDHTALSTFEYRNGTWFLTFETDTPRRITIVDSARAMKDWEDADDGKGSTDLNKQSYTLSTGETVVKYPGTVYDGQAAISVSTADASRFIFTGGIERDRQPVPWDTVLGLIAFAGLGTAYVTHRHVEGKYEAEDKEAERIA